MYVSAAPSYAQAPADKKAMRGVVAQSVDDVGMRQAKMEAANKANAVPRSRDDLYGDKENRPNARLPSRLPDIDSHNSNKAQQQQQQSQQPTKMPFGAPFSSNNNDVRVRLMDRPVPARYSNQHRY